MQPHLVARVGGRPRRDSEAAADHVAGGERSSLKTMLTGVVDDTAHGHRGRDPRLHRRRQDGHRAEAGRHGGYSTGKFVASFVGMVPASKPRLVVLVIVDEPTAAIFGGVVAAPAFAQIAKFDLQYLEVPPDALRNASASPSTWRALQRAAPRGSDGAASPSAVDSARDGPRPSHRGARPDRGRERGSARRSPTSPTTRDPSRPARSSSASGAQRVDGHDLAADAVAAGAAALVVEQPVDVPVPQLVVESVRAAMPAAAGVFFGDPSCELDVAAITGTNGKTTSAFLLARDSRRRGPASGAARRTSSAASAVSCGRRV